MGITECDSTSATSWDTLDLSPGITAGSTVAILSVRNTSDVPINNSLTNGENSFNCSEESCNNPFADSIITFESIYNLCSEEAEDMVFQKGNKICLNRKLSEETKKKISESLMGKLSPNKGRKFPSEFGRKISNYKKGKPSWNKGKKGIYSEETLRKMADAKKGICPSSAWKKGDNAMEKNPAWRGGISFEPYCPKFNNKLKEHTRERDNRTCQLCGIKENGKMLDIHHVHYDKPNCNPDLIALCHNCHSKVNHNRDYWENYFMNLLKIGGIL